MPKTYVIAKPHSIQSRSFEAGEVVGTGDIGKGEFVPAKGLEDIVALGHVEPRLANGRIQEQKAAESTPKRRGRKPTTQELKDIDNEHA